MIDFHNRLNHSYLHITSRAARGGKGRWLAHYKVHYVAAASTTACALYAKVSIV